jgi:chorismate dehydratase
MASHAPRPRELRVGTVPYLVGRPLDLGLEREAGVTLEQHVPAELVERLRRGALDVALVSSIELFRRPGYRWLPHAAVAGRGFVGSVQVFLRKPLAEVRTLALDPASRAAAALVAVLLRESAPAAELCEVAGDPRAASADAWLRIGDEALRELHAPDAPATFNPSAEWTRRTGLPFVFAAWIVRPGVELAAGELEAFARAHERGTRARAELAERAAREWRLPLAACRKYLLEECLYTPGAELEPALYAFRDRAAPLGLCSAELAPRAVALHSDVA